MFNAIVVSQLSPKELLANVDDIAGDLTLKRDQPLRGKVDPNTAFKFKGVVDCFVGNPYRLTLTIRDPKTDIEGLPAGFPAAAPKKQ
jgi:hypothetical protein